MATAFSMRYVAIVWIAFSLSACARSATVRHHGCEGVGDKIALTSVSGQGGLVERSLALEATARELRLCARTDFAENRGADIVAVAERLTAAARLASQAGETQRARLLLLKASSLLRSVDPAKISPLWRGERGIDLLRIRYDLAGQWDKFP